MSTASPPPVLSGSAAIARQGALLALTESCWLFVVALTLAAIGGSSNVPSWPLWLLASFINLWANLLPEPAGGSRLLLASRLIAAALAILVLGFLPLRPEFVGAALYVVWHSRALAERDVPEDRYRATVFAGSIGVLLALLARAFLPAQADAALAPEPAFTAAFAVAALASLVVAQRLQLIEGSELAPSGRQGWGIAVGVGLVGAVATAVLVVLAPLVARGGLALLATAGQALAAALYFLLLPVLTLIFLLLYAPLARLMRGVHWLQPHQMTQTASNFDQLRQQQGAVSAALDRWLHAAGWLLVALAILAALFWVSRGIRRQTEQARRRTDVRRSVWRWSLLADWLHRPRKRGGADDGAGSPWPILRRFSQPSSVRDLYVDVQRHAVRLGCGREPDQTALEHCAVLAQRLPAVEQSLRRLAVGYGDERYGGVSPEVALSALTPDWRRVVEECRANERHGT